MCYANCMQNWQIFRNGKQITQLVKKQELCRPLRGLQTLEQGCQRSGKSQGKFLFFKVREKSGNFVMNAHDTFFITILHLYVPYFSALYGPTWKNPYIFLCYMIFPPIRVSWKKICVLVTVYWLIQVVIWYLVFSFTDKFSFQLPWSKIS